jgi:hypothetical protein
MRGLLLLAVPERYTTRQEKRAIFKEWRRVPFKTRLEVLRLAKRGECHSDIVVDAAAVQYARVAMERPTFLHTTAFQAIFSFALLAFAVMADDAFPRWCAGLGGGACLLLTIFNWDLKRDAKKILSVPRDGAPRQ